MGADPHLKGGGSRRPCPGLWKTPVIRHDGQVMACCADVDGHIEVGNLKDQSFQALWEGENMKRYRLWHIQGEFHQIPRCEGCGGIGWIEMSDQEIYQWLEEVGRLDLFPHYLSRLGRSPAS